MPPTALPDRAPGFDVGALRITQLPGLDVRIHWSFPVVLYLVAGARWDLGHALGVIVLCIVRVLGQAGLVRRVGGRVTAVRFHALGGDILWRGETQPTQRSWVALGGALATLVVFFLVRWALAEGWLPTAGRWAGTGVALTHTARVLLFVHLLPFWPLDGYELWRMPLRALESWSVREQRRRLHTPSPGVRVGPLEVPEEPVDEVEAVVAPHEAAAVEQTLQQLWADARKAPPTGSGGAD